MNRLFIFILLITSFLSAQDEWKLKDGTTIKGEKVDRVGGVYNIELDSGESIIGKIVFEDTKLIRLDVVGSKPVELYWENIRNIIKAENEDDGTGRIIDNSDQLVINRAHEEHITPGAPIIDFDGNEYETVVIGDQVWMAENLRVTHYNDGTPIQTGLSNDEWGSTRENRFNSYEEAGAYSVYNDNEENSDTHGYLYNWYAINNNNGLNIAPDGWHVPTKEEVLELINYLGFDNREDIDGCRGCTIFYGTGNKLKERGSSSWGEYNEATNESGFRALPSGRRWGHYALSPEHTGTYDTLGELASFWTSTDKEMSRAFQFAVDYMSSQLRVHSGFIYGKSWGNPVRLIKDE